MTSDESGPLLVEGLAESRICGRGCGEVRPHDHARVAHVLSDHAPPVPI